MLSCFALSGGARLSRAKPVTLLDIDESFRVTDVTCAGPRGVDRDKRRADLWRDIAAGRLTHEATAWKATGVSRRQASC